MIIQDEKSKKNSDLDRKKQGKIKRSKNASFVAD